MGLSKPVWGIYKDMSYSLTSLKGAYIGHYMGD